MLRFEKVLRHGLMAIAATAFLATPATARGRVPDTKTLSCDQVARYFRINRDEAGPLMQAILCQNAAKVRVVLSQGVDPNENLGNESALRVAVRLGATEIIEALISAGADINGNESDHYTPLLAAIDYFIETSDWRPFDLLITSGADPAIRTKNPPFTIPEHLALIGQYKKIHDLLDRGYRRELDVLLDLIESTREYGAAPDRKEKRLVARIQSMIDASR